LDAPLLAAHLPPSLYDIFWVTLLGVCIQNPIYLEHRQKKHGIICKKALENSDCVSFMVDDENGFSFIIDLDIHILSN
jgi:hypothetical protein